MSFSNIWSTTYSLLWGFFSLCESMSMKIKFLFTLAKLTGLKLLSYRQHVSTLFCMAETWENHTHFLLIAAVSSATDLQKVCRNMSIIYGFLHYHFPFCDYGSAELKYEAHPHNTSQGSCKTPA